MDDQYQHPYFGFNLYYAGEINFCKAVMCDTWYQIFFNRKPVAELVMNDDMEWMLAAGIILPAEIVYKIGRKIEARYL